MFSVNTNLGAMAALNSLNMVEASLKETQNQISTGKKISSSSDNPAVYTIAQTMQANVQGLTAVADSLNFGTSVVSTALSAATQVGSVLAQLKNTITQGQQTGMDPVAVQASVTQMLKNIDQIAQSATFNGVNLTASSGSGVGASHYKLSVVDNVSGGAITVDPLGDSLTPVDAAGLGISNLRYDDNQVTLAFSSATAITDGDKIDIVGKNAAGAATTFSFYFVTSGSTESIDADTDTQKSYQVSFDDTADSNNLIMAKLATVMRQHGFGATIDDQGILNVTGNAAASATSTNGDITAGIIGASGHGAVYQVDQVIGKVNSVLAYLGAKQNQISGMSTYTSQLSTALTAGIGALTDADMAAESAKLQSLQTRQSLAIQSLSIANQQPQSIMTLFR